MGQQIIEIIGLPGSGKTTLSKFLATKLKYKYVDVDLFKKNPFLKLSLEDRKRWSFATGISFCYERINRIKQILLKNKPNSKMIFDSNLDMGIYVYSKNNLKQNNMTRDEFDLLEKIYQSLLSNKIKPNTTIVIIPTIEELVVRIKNRNRDFEKKYSFEYLSGLDKCLKNYIKKNSNKNYIFIKNKEIISDKKNLKIINLINKYVRNFK